LLVLFGVFPGGFGFHCSVGLLDCALNGICSSDSKKPAIFNDKKKSRKLTKRAFASTLDLSSPPWHLGSLQRVWREILRGAVVPIAAAREVLGALR
jgi:hypothetical protein